MNVSIKKAVAAVAMSFAALSANAALVATPNGPFAHLDDGYTASIYSLGNQGSVGITFNAAGQLIRSNFSGGLYVHSLLADTTVNGASTIHSSVFHQVTGASISGYGMTLGNDNYIYAQSNGGLRKIDATTYVATTVAGTASGTYGIKTLSNGKIVYNANDNTVHLYDPTTGIDTMIFNSGTFNDDLAVTPDGYIVVASLGNCTTKIITQAGALVNSQSSANCADGMAYGQGRIFKNNTNGTLTALSFAGPNYTGAVTEQLIADGFGYGDLAAVGPDNAFYITTTSATFPNGASAGAWNVIRIAAVGGGGFGNEVPEPGTMALASLALAGLSASLRRRKFKS